MATTGLWLFTGGLWLATFRLGRDAKTSGAAQAEKMERSIREAAKAAAAMEGVATSMALNAEQIVESVRISGDIAKQQRTYAELQMRSYVTVLIGHAYYQDGESRFAAKPLILNAGSVPAKNLTSRIKAAILPAPLPSDVVLDLVDAVETTGGMIPHGQSVTLFAMVSGLVPDDRIAKIMRGEAQGLYVWGDITYDDALGRGRTTEFCQNLIFIPKADGTGFTVEGFYIAGRNTAT